MTEEVPRTPPPLAVAHAEQGAKAALSSKVNISSAGVLVAEAMLGIRPFTVNHVAAMARHNYDYDSTNGLLLGGAEGQEWARAALTLAARAAASAAPTVDLADLSAKLNEADRLFREKLEAVLSQAMKAAARRAYKKAGARLANPRRCNAADREKYNREWRDGRITAAMLAATGTTADELLDESFDDAADQCKILYQERQDRKRKALLLALGLLGLGAASLDDQWSHVEDARASSIAAYLVTALFNEARARFDAGTPFSTKGPGEIPRDIDVPTRIVADVELIADGATLDPNSSVVPADQGTGDASAVLTDYTDDLVQQIMEQFVPGLTTTYEWNVGDPARPFEPHQNLAGEEATNETYFVVFAKDPADFPEGNTYWLPGDHLGCQCWLSTVYGQGDASDLDVASEAVDG